MADSAGLSAWSSFPVQVIGSFVVSRHFSSGLPCSPGGRPRCEHFLADFAASGLGPRFCLLREPGEQILHVLPVILNTLTAHLTRDVETAAENHPGP